MEPLSLDLNHFKVFSGENEVTSSICRKEKKVNIWKPCCHVLIVTLSECKTLVGVFFITLYLQTKAGRVFDEVKNKGLVGWKQGPDVSTAAKRLELWFPVWTA